MKIKVCGMREAQNVEKLINLKPDYIGFIFYGKSKRYISQFPQVKIPNSIKKVGVFVNESVGEVIRIIKECDLQVVQLHGDETVEYCSNLLRAITDTSPNFVAIIKAFSVDDHFDFEKTKAYDPFCNLFIFDTKGVGYGGTGLKYDWNLLEKYNGNTPFLLSGGIGVNDVNAVLDFQHVKMVGVDLNSGFEDAPGVKNIEKLHSFIKSVKKQKI
ncbi:phosphoribosylanthranilate isomerase [Urechidicola sp. KH5]